VGSKNVDWREYCEQKQRERKRISGKKLLGRACHASLALQAEN
jgi:hypothetical protein